MRIIKWLEGRFAIYPLVWGCKALMLLFALLAYFFSGWFLIFVAIFLILGFVFDFRDAQRDTW